MTMVRSNWSPYYQAYLPALIPCRQVGTFFDFLSTAFFGQDRLETLDELANGLRSVH